MPANLSHGILLATLVSLIAVISSPVSHWWHQPASTPEPLPAVAAASTTGVWQTEGWYQIPQALGTFGYLKARFAKSRLEPDQPVPLELVFGSPWQAESFYLNVRVIPLDPFARPDQQRLEPTPWKRLAPQQRGAFHSQWQTGLAHRPGPMGSGGDLWFETDLDLAPGNYQLEFQIEAARPTSWLPEPRCLAGWCFRVPETRQPRGSADSPDATL